MDPLLHFSAIIIQRNQQAEVGGKEGKKKQCKKDPKSSSPTLLFWPKSLREIFQKSDEMKNISSAMRKAPPMRYHFVIESCKGLGSAYPAYILCDVNLLFLAPLCTYIILKDICKQSLTFHLANQTNMYKRRWMHKEALLIYLQFKSLAHKGGSWDWKSLFRSV